MLKETTAARSAAANPTRLPVVLTPSRPSSLALWPRPGEPLLRRRAHLCAPEGVCPSRRLRGRRPSLREPGGAARPPAVLPPGWSRRGSRLHPTFAENLLARQLLRHALLLEFADTLQLLDGGRFARR